MQKRIEYIDLAKGFCIILVVIYHLTEYYSLQMPLNNFFKAFRLPLYFFLSGMFFKDYGSFLEFVKRKTNKLIIPFVFWFLLFSVGFVQIQKACGLHLWNVKDYSIVYCLTDWITRETFPNAPIWFLICLFEVNILFYMIYKIKDMFSKYGLYVLVVLSLFVGLMGGGTLDVSNQSSNVH